LVERQFCKLDVAGSIPAPGSSPHLFIQEPFAYMKFLSLVSLWIVLAMSAYAAGDSAAHKLWLDLEAKRNKLDPFHQEFDVNRTFHEKDGTVQSAIWQVLIDGHGQNWRERRLSGSCNCLILFDGRDLFSMEERNHEFTREAYKPKSPLPLPTPYTIPEPNWPKAVEVERRPCAPPVIQDECVLLQVPVQARTISSVSPTQYTKGAGGVRQMLMNTVNGLLISSTSVEVNYNHYQTWNTEITYQMTKMAPVAAPDSELFSVPARFNKEVHNLTEWDTSAFRKQLMGNPAPPLAFRDMQGNSIALESLRGKTVLLDFWATWCPPCRADGKALNKLFAKYRDKGLQIVGISVDEEREVVEKYLQGAPDNYPIVLTTENEMPEIYKVEALPTYILIDPDGKVSWVTSGDQGFSELQARLRKAGLDTD
jgi:thiol-disulfide isomerase/thioredoxin